MVKLFCIPYSGGSASVYSRWKKMLNRYIQLCPIELAGRGERMLEEKYKSVEEAAIDICNSIEKQLAQGEHYMIFGHSLGALLAYECYYELKKRKYHEPDCIFFSGRASPQTETVTHIYTDMGDEEFLANISVYGGNLNELAQNKDLLDLFLPIMRTDFQIAELYEYPRREQKINCDISILNGKQDASVENINMESWSELTERKCEIKYFDGGHFFIMEDTVGVTDYINRKAFEIEKNMK